jgi:hypothetical protein
MKDIMLKYTSKFNNLNYMLFVPGIFLILAAGAVMLAPQLIAALLSGFLVFAAVASWILAWKLVKVKKSFDAVAKKFGGSKVVVQGFVGQQEANEEIVEQDLSRKIFFH